MSETIPTLEAIEAAQPEKPRRLGGWQRKIVKLEQETAELREQIEIRDLALAEVGRRYQLALAEIQRLRQLTAPDYARRVRA